MNQVPPPPPPSPPASGGAPGVPGVPSAAPESKKLACGITGILLGAFGIHKFILGYTKEALIMLLVTVLTCGIGGVVMSIIGLVEGIIYLTKSDAEFVQTYQVGKKAWF